MKVLIFIPQSRTIPPSLESIGQLDTTGYDVTRVFQTDGDHEGDTAWQNVTRKYQFGRQMALDGGYDAMLCIEDDIIIPPNTLHQLDALHTDIAYGLVTGRRAPHQWSACYECGPEDGNYRAFDMDPHKMRAAWGRVVDVIGCGLFCTLIRRNVLEALPFELRGSRCCDFYHAYDAYKAGFTQKCDTRVLCGHVMSSEAPRQVVYPDGDMRFRHETIGGGAFTTTGPIMMLVGGDHQPGDELVRVIPYKGDPSALWIGRQGT